MNSRAGALLATVNMVAPALALTILMDFIRFMDDGFRNRGKERMLPQSPAPKATHDRADRENRAQRLTPSPILNHEIGRKKSEFFTVAGGAAPPAG